MLRLASSAARASTRDLVDRADPRQPLLERQLEAGGKRRAPGPCAECSRYGRRGIRAPHLGWRSAPNARCRPRRRGDAGSAVRALLRPCGAPRCVDDGLRPRDRDQRRPRTPAAQRARRRPRRLRADDLRRGATVSRRANRDTCSRARRAMVLVDVDAAGRTRPSLGLHSRPAPRPLRRARLDGLAPAAPSTCRRRMTRAHERSGAERCRVPRASTSACEVASSTVDPSTDSIVDRCELGSSTTSRSRSSRPRARRHAATSPTGRPARPRRGPKLPRASGRLAGIVPQAGREAEACSGARPAGTPSSRRARRRRAVPHADEVPLRAVDGIAPVPFTITYG